jgi:hypothetical protein
MNYYITGQIPYVLEPFCTQAFGALLGISFVRAFCMITFVVDKLQLTLQKMGLVFNSGSGLMCDVHLCCFEAKWPNLKLKTQPKQLLGYLPLAFMPPAFLNVPT